MTLQIIFTIIIILCSIVACFSKFRSIYSPLSMLVVVLSFILMIPYFFEQSSFYGWIMVGLTLFNYVTFIKSVKLYFEENKI